MLVRVGAAFFVFYIFCQGFDGAGGSVFAQDVQGVSLEQSLKETYDKSELLKHENDDVRQVATAYRDHDFAPFWVQEGRLLESTQNVLSTLKNADKEGLNPQDYQKAILLIEAGKLDDPFKDEVTITKAVLRYIDDLAGERLNPKRIDKELYLRKKEIDAGQVLSSQMAKDPGAGWLKVRTVDHPQYQFLKKTLADLHAQKGKQPYPVLEPGKPLKPGDQTPRVKVLQEQLQDLGILTEPFQPGVFDPVTQKAVEDYQNGYGLTADGVVGPQTLQALNGESLQERIQKTIVTMERWRWFPTVFPERYVLVNIAGFYLKAFQGGKAVLSMPVIIGQQYRHTPVFDSQIYSVRFNPSWHVPHSIAVRDKLAKIRRDPGYLERGGYVLYDASGTPISPYSVNWNDVTASNFDFRIRQVPGKNNALGKIRFAIKSNFGVYLHDTDDHELFKRSNRSLSSGCIRVGEPAALGSFVFDGQDGFNQQKVQESMEGTQTENVALIHPVPVYINYLTVWETPSGKAHFARDIYGQDKLIWKALQNLSKTSS